jgi:hypothetical protein
MEIPQQSNGNPIDNPIDNPIEYHKKPRGKYIELP